MLSPAKKKDFRSSRVAISFLIENLVLNLATEAPYEKKIQIEMTPIISIYFFYRIIFQIFVRIILKIRLKPKLNQP